MRQLDHYYRSSRKCECHLVGCMLVCSCCYLSIFITLILYNLRGSVSMKNGVKMFSENSFMVCYFIQ